MLKETNEYIKLKNRHTLDRDGEAEALLHVITKYGSPDDANALLELYLKDSYHSWDVLDSIRVLGDIRTAKRIFQKCIKNGRLKRQFDAKILHCLGYLGFEPAKDVLFRYACGGYDDYYHNKPSSEMYERECSACLGLIHLNVEEYRSTLSKKIKNIKKILQKKQCLASNNDIPELLPIFSYKLFKKDFVSKLGEWGRLIRCGDCYNGFVIGIALFGQVSKKKAKRIFLKIILGGEWNDKFSGGTGVTWYLYWGMQHLGITFDELYKTIIKKAKKSSKEERWDMFRSFRGLLSIRIDNPLPDLKFIQKPTETLEEVYNSLFSVDDDARGSILDIIERYKLDYMVKEDFYNIRDKMEMAIKNEAEIKFLSKISHSRFSLG